MNQDQSRRRSKWTGGGESDAVPDARRGVFLIGETALDLSFCIRGADDFAKPGFYLIMAMGSEQSGLAGLKGSIVRKAAVGRSVSNLQNALTGIRKTLESRTE